MADRLRGVDCGMNHVSHLQAAPSGPAHEIDELRAAATRFLTHHQKRSPAQMLAEFSDDDVRPDRYGEGGVVAELERTVADLLGFPAAMFAPSGTMAQQIALRIHADRAGCRTVAWHPTSHLALHELDAASRLHGLAPRPVGDARRLLVLGDLEEVADPLGAVLFELPQRELGGQLPEWKDLCEQVAFLRTAGVATHLDGARLWEAAAGYERSHDEIAALFDSVYVSFYKGLGGLAGCCLAGDEDLIAQAREWRSRHGGTLFALWPYAAAALAGLRLRLPRMASYRSHARAIASALQGRPDVEVIPNPPPTSMMHLRLRADRDALKAAMLRIAAEDGIWSWPDAYRTDSPAWQVVELSVGDATLEWSPEDVADFIDRLLAEAQAARL